MRTFTKMLLAIALLAIYVTGYSANLKFRVSNDGVYIPKNPVVTQNDVSLWIGKSGSRITSMVSKHNLDWKISDKEFSRKLEALKRYPYSFTANSSNTSMMGVNLYSAAIKWDEGKLKPSLTASPNPSTGKFRLTLSQAYDAKYRIIVSNTIGKEIKSILITESAKNKEYVIDLSDKPAGVYFYSLLVNDKMVETKRLIIQQ